MRLGLLALALAGAFCTVPAHAEHALLVFDKARSSVVAVTHRSGLLGFLGHEHAILATRWFTNARLDNQHVERSTVEVTVPTDGFEVDSAEARKLAKLTSGGPGPKDVIKIREKMMGPSVLDAQKYPEIHFASTSVERKGPGSMELVIRGTLTLHGVSRPVVADAGVKVLASRTAEFSGEIHFKMSDFGIKPPSTGGVVNVKDEMEIRFDFVTSAPTAIAAL